VRNSITLALLKNRKSLILNDIARDITRPGPHRRSPFWAAEPKTGSSITEVPWDETFASHINAMGYEMRASSGLREHAGEERLLPTLGGKMKTVRISWAVMVGFAMALSAAVASAQLNSGAQTIALNANLAESLSVTLSANTVNFALSAGSATNAGSAGITATTAWTLAPGRNSVGVYAYFASAAAALTDGAGDNIPSSAFFISDNGGASAALTNTVAYGAANAGLKLATVPITAANRSASRTDAMTFNINLTGGTLPQLPANTYAGTLNIQAQATP
jgi:hypothetical protein